jgi:hypothetical protein
MTWSGGSRRRDSNPEPPDYKSGALPVAPRRRSDLILFGWTTAAATRRSGRTGGPTAGRKVATCANADRIGGCSSRTFGGGRTLRRRGSVLGAPNVGSYG